VWRFVLWRRRRRMGGIGSSVILVDEFTGQRIEGHDRPFDGGLMQWSPGSAGRLAGEDLLSDDPLGEDMEDTADLEEAQAVTRDALARYEAGDQGWGMAADDGSDAEPSKASPSESGVADGGSADGPADGAAAGAPTPEDERPTGYRPPDSWA
jgi:hypothetical protein